MHILANRIKTRRDYLGLSQTELAERTGYSDRSGIAKIEKGVNDLNQSKITMFAEALETTPAYLMGWTDDPYDYDKDPENILAEIPSAQWREWSSQGLSNREIWQRYQSVQSDSFEEAQRMEDAVPKTVDDLSPDALELARAFDGLSPEAKETIRNAIRLMK